MQNPFNAVAQWWHNWMATRANIASLDCCGSEEAERIAHDVGVTPSELRTLAGKWPDSADLLNARLVALDLDRQEIQRTEPQVLSDLQRVCTMCASGRECKHDLAQSPDDPVWRPCRSSGSIRTRSRMSSPISRRSSGEAPAARRHRAADSTLISCSLVRFSRTPPTSDLCTMSGDENLEHDRPGIGQKGSRHGNSFVGITRRKRGRDRNRIGCKLIAAPQFFCARSRDHFRNGRGWRGDHDEVGRRGKIDETLYGSNAFDPLVAWVDEVNRALEAAIK